MRAYQGNFRSRQTDTLVAIGPRHYWLHLSQVADSTQPLEYAPATVAGKYFAAPSDTAWRTHRVRGYEGTYTFTLRDSARQKVVFSQKLHKRDFLPSHKGEVLTLSEPEFYYRGYSRGLGSLLFLAYFGLPYSDVIDRTALLLDARSGRVRGLYGIGSASFEAIDCDPQVAPSGQSVLTCAGQLLRPHRPPLSLRRPHAELRAARFLTDTTLLVVYEFGDYGPARREAADAATEEDAGPLPVAGAATAQRAQPPMELVTTPAQRRQPNAFVLSTNGRQLAAFHYDGWELGMGYSMPRRFVAATRTYYLLNGENDKPRSLVLLPKARPDSIIQLPLKTLAKFQPPRRRSETRFVISDNATNFIFYADSSSPGRIRYTRRAAVN
jgi:hypothetical protein